MSTGMRIRHLEFSAQRACDGAQKPRRPRRAAQTSAALAESAARLKSALLFADVADASGGRIAVFYRDGLAARELGVGDGHDDQRAHRAVLDKVDGRW